MKKKSSLPQYDFGSWLGQNAVPLLQTAGGAALVATGVGTPVGVGMMAGGVGQMASNALTPEQQVNPQQLPTTIANRQYAPTFANGGMMPQVYEGQNHNGPNGGIPIDSKGNPTIVSKNKPVALVENNEVSWMSPQGTPYIFSDKLGFAKQAKGVMNKYKMRLGENFDKSDKLALEGLNSELGRLMGKQEQYKIEKDILPPMEQFAVGGPVIPLPPDAETVRQQKMQDPKWKNFPGKYYIHSKTTDEIYVVDPKTGHSVVSSTPAVRGWQQGDKENTVNTKTYESKKGATTKAGSYAIQKIDKDRETLDEYGAPFYQYKEDATGYTGIHAFLKSDLKRRADLASKDSSLERCYSYGCTNVDKDWLMSPENTPVVGDSLFITKEPIRVDNSGGPKRIPTKVKLADGGPVKRRAEFDVGYMPTYGFDGFDLSGRPINQQPEFQGRQPSNVKISGDSPYWQKIAQANATAFNNRDRSSIGRMSSIGVPPINPMTQQLPEVTPRLMSPSGIPVGADSYSYAPMSPSKLPINRPILPQLSGRAPIGTTPMYSADSQSYVNRSSEFTPYTYDFSQFAQSADPRNMYPKTEYDLKDYATNPLYGANPKYQSNERFAVTPYPKDGEMSVDLADFNPNNYRGTVTNINQNTTVPNYTGNTYNGFEIPINNQPLNKYSGDNIADVNYGGTKTTVDNLIPEGNSPKSAPIALTTTGSSPLNMGTMDYVGYGMQAAVPLANMAFTLANKPKEIKPSYIAPEQINLESEREALRRDATTASNVNKRNARGGSFYNFYSNALAGSNAAQRNLGDALSKSYLNQETTNAQLRGQANMTNLEQDRYFENLNSQEKGAYLSNLAGSFGQVGQFGAGFMRDRNQMKSAQTYADNMGTNYLKYDKETGLTYHIDPATGEKVYHKKA